MVGLGDTSRESYAQAVANRRRALVNACYGLPADCVFVQSDKSATEPLLELLARRRKA